ncbi:uncharacterized mitochondrial protein AtMg00310-like [Rutidosis leptorrhynchoides]|uniref:uncharacterized mitochondrial protein AtMg00310-like n=1 Tax=Rutidosis leptorrhynchoides TaxID=125765 RepID=UPI003A9A37D1
MGFQVGSFPFTYLRLPIGSRMRKLNDWSAVIDKFNSRLAGWKMRSMSFGRRLVLIKSVLSSLPLYYFSLFRAPPCVIKVLESVRRNFFWGGSGSDSKIPWVKWEHVLNTFGNGGLNIGSLRGKNLALLGKWWWRFKTETESLWVKVIRSIHGPLGGLLSDNVSTHSSTIGVWHNIIRAGTSMEALQVNFRDSFSKTIGDGGSTLFWHEEWIGDLVLGAGIGDVLSNFNLDQGNNDRWRWKLASDGIFRVRNLTAELDCKLLATRPSNQVTIRNNLVPKKSRYSCGEL